MRRSINHTRAYVWLVAGVISVLSLTGNLANSAECEQSGNVKDLPPPPNYPETRPEYSWQGEWRCLEVAFPSARSGAMLFGVLFSPADLSAVGRLPAVVIGPGSGSATQLNVQWSARDLAGHGYIALSVDPQGNGRSEALGEDCPADGCPGAIEQQVDNYVDLFVSGLNFLSSFDNPWRHHVDTVRIGLAGHSQSARAASFVQGDDQQHRVKAIVAWDNLSKDLNGDAGSSSGSRLLSAIIGFDIQALVEPRPVNPLVPAMGQANDNPASSRPLDPEIKKTAYNYWREFGKPSMQLVFQESAHGDWGQNADSPSEEKLRLFQYYTRAWFDFFLKDDTSALNRLFAKEVLGVKREELLDDQFHSAVFLPGINIDCPDFVNVKGDCELPGGEVSDPGGGSETTQTRPAGSGSSGGGTLSPLALALLCLFSLVARKYSSKGVLRILSGLRHSQIKIFCSCWRYNK